MVFCRFSASKVKAAARIYFDCANPYREALAVPGREGTVPHAAPLKPVSSGSAGGALQGRFLAGAGHGGQPSCRSFTAVPLATRNSIDFPPPEISE